MQPLDYVHAFCLCGVALYLWWREPPRLLLTPLMLLGFLVLYGIGAIVYLAQAETVPQAREAVTLSLIIMWPCLLIGAEVARLSMPLIARRAAFNATHWSTLPVINDKTTDQLLVALCVVLALFMLGMFFALGKPGQLQTYFALQSTQELKKFRLELGGQGGYFYQTLVVSIGPFLSFLLFSKARASNDSMLLLIALAMAAAVLAGKIGSFQKIPWVIYLLQLLMLFQVWKRLDFSFGRAALLLICLLAGALAASFVALPELDASQLAEFLVYRFFQVNAEVVYQTFYVYPHYLPHTWGMNIGLIHSIFGSGELSAAHTQVANFFGAEGATFDAFYIADAWVDFGYGGVMVMSLLVGFVVKSVDCFVTSMGKTPLAMALLVSGTYGLFQLMVTSAFTAFLSGGLVLIPLLVLASNGLVNDVARARIQWQR